MVCRSCLQNTPASLQWVLLILLRISAHLDPIRPTFPGLVEIYIPLPNLPYESKFSEGEIPAIALDLADQFYFNGGEADSATMIPELAVFDNATSPQIPPITSRSGKSKS